MVLRTAGPTANQPEPTGNGKYFPSDILIWLVLFALAFLAGCKSVERERVELDFPKVEYSKE